MYLLTVKRVDKKNESWYVGKTITKIETKNIIKNCMNAKQPEKRYQNN